jgi:WD40 repeat protein
VNLWQVASGELLHRWQAHAGPIFGLDFNSDGSLLATAGDPGEVKLWGLAP